MNPCRLVQGGWLLVLVLCSALRAGVYYEQEARVSGPGGVPGQPVKQVCHVSGTKMRVEIEAEGGKSTMIRRWDLNKMYVLVPQQKVAMESLLPPRDPKAEDRVQVEVTKTDETGKIGQYACTRHDANVQGRTTRFWVTTELDLGAELNELWGALGRVAVEPKVAEEMAKTAACPIMIEKPSLTGTVTTVITTVRVQPIPDAMFEVPEGYKIIPVPTR